MKFERKELECQDFRMLRIGKFVYKLLISWFMAHVRYRGSEKVVTVRN